MRTNSFLKNFTSSPHVLSALIISSVVCLGPGTAQASNITVGSINAQADIYQAAGADGSGGVAPTIINITGLTSITFSVPTSDKVTLNGYTYNDPDGVGSADSDSFNTGFGGIAGLTAPNDGFLAGVFLGPSISSVTPTALSFSSTNFLTLSPQLQQAFFIGDGLTGDGTGQVQTFYVPAGATQLVLGISDACGYHGSPSCYDDNSGAFLAVTAAGATSTVSSVPLPSSAPMFGAALLALGAVGYGIKRKAAAAA